MGRIEHTLLDEGRASSPTDLRPTPATPPLNPTIPHKVTNVSICDKRSEPRTGGCGGSDPMSEPVSRARGDTLDARYIECARPTGGSHGLTIDDPAQRFRG